MKRLLQAIPMILLITVICFLLIQLAPYDAVDAITQPNMTQETVDAMRAKYGLDQPWHIQYIRWLQNILRGDFGYSIVTHMSISQDILSRLPYTIKLVLPAYLTAFFAAIGLGLLAGSNRNRWIDKAIDGFCSIGLSTPTFWFAMMLMYVFGYLLSLLPVMGTHTIGAPPTLYDSFRHFVMPFTTLVFAFLPELTRYVRSSTITQLKEDYVMVQRAFGSPKRTILLRHVSKNVLLPIITKFGMALPLLVTGAIITESIFGWPGIGPYYIRAVRGLDYPVIMAILILSSTLVIVGNLISDISYFIADPRIQSRG